MAKKITGELVPELTNGEFEKYTEKGFVLVDFFAEWCMPCLMMAPIIEELAEDFQGKVKFAKMNIEDHQELTRKFEIRSIPTFILFQDGEIVEQFTGSMNKEEFESRINNLI